ncbi:MAG: hypothetical protein IRZ05_16825 [Micromonosporaceae bacterium]|nr:hypothetical protein [Micromonosporaceae bacterium]
MSCDEVLEVSDPVERAGVADELMWTSHPRRSALREVRAAAIQQALASGRSVDDLARRLKVTPADIRWMGEQHGEPLTSRRGRRRRAGRFLNEK